MRGLPVLKATELIRALEKAGFQAALIQKEDIRDYLDRAWTVSALRGLDHHPNPRVLKR